MNRSPLIAPNSNGLYCELGKFYIDPWKPSSVAVITHAHADHAYIGHELYYCTPETEVVIKARLGPINTVAKNYGEIFELGGCKVSFHPAGHVLGSAQVRVEDKQTKSVWIMTGDYKRTPDPTCMPFEVVPCDVLISEATFGLPVYSWPETTKEVQKIYEFAARYEGPTIIFAYAFGKAQRILSELGFLNQDIPVYEHGSVFKISELYREMGQKIHSDGMPPEKVSTKSITLAPPSAFRSQWMKRFKAPQTGFGSGWMAIRGNKRRKGYDLGFVISDHCDWNELIRTVRDTGAKTVYFTHGQTDVIVKYVSEEMGVHCEALKTLFGETED